MWGGAGREHRSGGGLSWAAGPEWRGSAGGRGAMSQVRGVCACAWNVRLHSCVARVRLWVSTVSAHMWQRLTYVVCLNVYSVSVWYPHMFWGSLWVWSLHTHVAGAGLYRCVCALLCVWWPHQWMAGVGVCVCAPARAHAPVCDTCCLRVSPVCVRPWVCGGRTGMW